MTIRHTGGIPTSVDLTEIGESPLTTKPTDVGDDGVGPTIEIVSEPVAAPNITWANCWYDPTKGRTLHTDDDITRTIQSLLRACRVLEADIRTVGTTFPSPWMWRGQARHGWQLQPSMFARVSGPLNASTERIKATEQLIAAARQLKIDRHDGAKLPELALLARLQHQGAATPLLDVSTDFLTALYMATVDAPNSKDDPGDAVLFAIRRPEGVIQRYDVRKIGKILTAVNHAAQIFHYQPPPVDLRLRIQRGSFLVCPTQYNHLNASLAASTQAALKTVIDKSGSQSRLSQVCAIRIPNEIKPLLARWLENLGFNTDDIYPTAFDHPHLGALARDHSRTAKWRPEPRTPVKRKPV
jgi:hypothetical protein